MNRFRWLHSEWPVSMRVLARRIKAKPFDDRSAHGFVLDRARDDYLEARYIERIEYTDTIVDPFGNELSFPRVEFRQSSFRAMAINPGLELRNPPRSTQALLNRLSEAVDFEVAINQIDVNVMDWATRFQHAAQAVTVVDSMQVNALELEPGVVAKAIIKGDKDTRSACATLTNGHRHTLEKVQLRLAERHEGTVVLTNSGSATLNANDPTEILETALRVSLNQAAGYI